MYCIVIELPPKVNKPRRGWTGHALQKCYSCIASKYLQCMGFVAFFELQVYTILGQHRALPAPGLLQILLLIPWPLQQVCGMGTCMFVSFQYSAMIQNSLTAAETRHNVVFKLFVSLQLQPVSSFLLLTTLEYINNSFHIVIFF